MLARPKERRWARVVEGAAVGVWILVCRQRATSGVVRVCSLWRSLLRSFALAASTAALALVALPTGASADPRVPPPACPPDVTLQGVERAAGGVILLGTVISVAPDAGRVRLAVDRWYHRGKVPGLAPGVHPATIDVALGRTLAASGRVAVAHLPPVGSRYFVAGTWPASVRGVSIACGIFADADLPIGAAWLERADARFLAVAPSHEQTLPALPLDAPWFLLGTAVAITLLAAMILGGVAERRAPAPAI
jgi:hypothetical protein